MAGRPSLFEAPRFVAGLNDMAVMRKAFICMILARMPTMITPIATATFLNIDCQKVDQHSGARQQTPHLREPRVNNAALGRPSRPSIDKGSN